MKKVLLCPPTSYDIKYTINPWMEITNKVDKAKVQNEFAALKALFQQLNVKTLEIPQAPDLPDMVYTANFGSPVDNAFIVSNYKCEERKGEARYAKAFFAKLGFTIRELPADVAFEGQGDLLRVGDTYFFGYGFRSDYAAKEYLNIFLKKEIISLQLINPHYYHLDTCFAPLSTDIVLINPDAFTKEGLEIIHHFFSHVIHASDVDNAVMACNLICIDKHILVGEGITQKLKSTLQQLGYSIHEIAMNEYRKGGGSVKCLSLLI